MIYEIFSQVQKVNFSKISKIFLDFLIKKPLNFLPFSEERPKVVKLAIFGQNWPNFSNRTFIEKTGYIKWSKLRRKIGFLDDFLTYATSHVILPQFWNTWFQVHCSEWRHHDNPFLAVLIRLKSLKLVDYGPMDKLFHNLAFYGFNSIGGKRLEKWPLMWS